MIVVSRRRLNAVSRIVVDTSIIEHSSMSAARPSAMLVATSSTVNSGCRIARWSGTSSTPTAVS